MYGIGQYTPGSPHLHPSSFADPPSTLSLNSTESSNLVDVLTTLCEQAKRTPACTEFQTDSGLLFLFAITAHSGPVSITLMSQHTPLIYEHVGEGATIIGWSNDQNGFNLLEENYQWAATDWKWLADKPIEAEGTIRKIANI